MINVDTAFKIILSSIKPSKKTTVNINNSLGMTLAKDIISKENIPPFDNSAMDGYAVRAADIKGASFCKPKILEVIEDLPAGYVSKKRLKKHTAIRIMTGAPVPKGADAVVIVENTRVKSQIPNPPGLPSKSTARAGKSKINPKSQIQNSKQQEGEYVEIFQGVKQGENIRKKGEDIRKGECVIKKGTIIGPAHIGMLASLGKAKVKVTKRPIVAILATGDELIDVTDKLQPGKIRNSNSYTLYGQILKYGGAPLNLGIAKDNPTQLISKLKLAKKADMVLVSGGISVGDYDLVKDVLKGLGTKMKFWKVRMRPGKPLAFGMLDGIPIFGLPGNPVSGMVSFELFVRPAILKMQGAKNLDLPRIKAIIDEDIDKKKGLRYFLRANVYVKDGKYHTRLTGPQGSGILKSMVKADGLIDLPEEASSVKKGDEVWVQMLS